MKPIVVLPLIIISVLTFNPVPVQAMIGLEAWCLSVGGTWDENDQWCFIDSSVTITAAESLIIMSPEDLIINPGASLNNQGTITIFGPYGHLQVFGGTLTNNGSIQIQGGNILISNNGYMSNEATISIFDNSRIMNTDFLINNGTITVEGSIYNSSTFISNGTIANCGIIDNFGTLKLFGPTDTCGHIYNEQSGLIYINSTLNINTDGYLSNSGMVENGGIINNNESFSTSGILVNTGKINNYGIDYHGGVLANSGEYNNLGIIYNEGTINILCSGLFSGNPPNINPVVYFQNCLFLPGIAK